MSGDVNTTKKDCITHHYACDCREEQFSLVARALYGFVSVDPNDVDEIRFMQLAYGPLARKMFGLEDCS